MIVLYSRELVFTEKLSFSFPLLPHFFFFGLLGGFELFIKDRRIGRRCKFPTGFVLKKALSLPFVYDGNFNLSNELAIKTTTISIKNLHPPCFLFLFLLCLFARTYAGARDGFGLLIIKLQFRWHAICIGKPMFMAARHANNPRVGGAVLSSQRSHERPWSHLNYARALICEYFPELTFLNYRYASIPHGDRHELMK